ncbi:MAG: response regulator [Elusimicrobia bacterium]|nr:response regulator [Elusimicrobiota bacterium]
MKNYYTTTEISKLLGVTTATVNGWINSKDLPAFKTPGGHNRIRQDILLEFLSKSSIPVPPELDTSSKPKILVVEDDDDVRGFILAVLEDLEYEVEVDIAKDGYMAGNKVVKYRPDLIILDIMLPGVSGIDICKRIREELGKNAKVLAITGYYSEENKNKMLEAGADAFMKKPMLLDEFTKMVNRLILACSNKYYLKKKGEQLVNS